MVLTTALPGETTSLIGLYAVKHNPFAYFASIQSGNDPDSSLKNMSSFTGHRGLFADLDSGHVATYSFIVPTNATTSTDAATPVRIASTIRTTTEPSWD